MAGGLITRPSLRGGYARNAQESVAPGLWRGLVGAWCPSLGVSGDQLRDLSGYKNHGTLLADTAWVPEDSWSLDFDGSTDDEVAIPFGSSMQTIFDNDEVTLSLWMITDSNALWDGIAGCSTDNNWADGFGLYFRSDGTPLKFYVDQDTATQFTGAPWTDGVWRHVTGTYSPDHGEIRIYVNGVLESFVSYSSIIQAHDLSDFRIGALQEPGDPYRMDGRIDDVRVYNRALTPAEVAQTFRQGRGMGMYESLDVRAFAVAAGGGDQNVAVAAIAAGAATVAPTQIHQTADVAAIAAGTATVAPQVDQTVPVSATGAATATVSPQVDQTVNVASSIAAATAIPAFAMDLDKLLDPIAAVTSVVAPQVDQTAPVAAIAASTAVVAPAQIGQTVPVAATGASTSGALVTQVDQTVNVGAVPGATTIVAPTVSAGDVVQVPAIAAGTATVAPQVSQTVLVPAIAASATVNAPSADQTVIVQPAGAGTDAVSPVIGIPVPVASNATATTALSPQINQTVPVSAMSAGTGIVLPSTNQTVLIVVVPASTAILAPITADDLIDSIVHLAARRRLVSPMDAGYQEVSLLGGRRRQIAVLAGELS